MKKVARFLLMGLVILVASSAALICFGAWRTFIRSNEARLLVFNFTEKVATVHGVVTYNPGSGPPDSPSFLVVSLPDGKNLEVMYANINGFAGVDEMCDHDIEMKNGFISNIKVGTKVEVRGRWQLDQSELQRGVKKKYLTICTAPDESITVEK